MRVPDFIIGGTLPSGTGHLYLLLGQHPNVWLAKPMQPECNFFAKSWEFEKGVEYYFHRWFADAPSSAVIGERSSLALSSDEAPSRIASTLPSVKLVFLLRNPVDRAYANYRFTALAGYEDLTFEEALEAEGERALAAQREGGIWREIRPYAYVSRGRYFSQLSRWLNRFDRNSMLIMRSDALLRHREEAMRKVFCLLGVDTSFQTQPASDLSSPAVRSAARQRALRLSTPAGEFDAAIQRLREGKPPQSDLDEEIRANALASVPPLTPQLRKKLTGLFREENRQLSQMVDFDLEDWLQ